MTARPWVGGLLAGLCFLLAGFDTTEKPAVIEVSADLPGVSDADCGQTMCRPGGNRVQLQLDGQRTIGFTVPKSPYVTKDGAIIIYPGETLEFDFPQAGDTLGTPRFLRDMKNGIKANAPATAGLPAALTVEFKQDMSGVNPFMIMNLRHTMAKTLKLDATVSGFTHEGLKQAHSSTCALMPKLTDIETWPGVLGPVVLTNGRVVDGGLVTTSGGVQTVSIGCE